MKISLMAWLILLAAIARGQQMVESWSGVETSGLTNQFVVDWDSDGDLDVVVDGLAPYVIENDGFGRFRGRAWPRGPRQIGLAVIQVSKDRYMDFIQGSSPGPPSTPPRLLVSRPDGSYADQSAQRLPMGLPIGGPLGAGDFSGDGREDFLYLANSGSLHLYVMQASGIFSDATANLPQGLPQGDWAGRIQICDYDADGDLDLHLISRRIDVLLRNDGTGSFTNHGYGAVDEPTLRSHFADFDRDGDLDLFVVVDGSRARHRLYVNHGNGRLLLHGWNLRAQEYSYHSAVGDLTGDGYPEIVLRPSGRTNGNPFRILSIGAGYSYRDVTNELLPPHFSSGPTESRIADFDNDGDLDLFAWNVNNRTTLFASTQSQTHTPMKSSIGSPLHVDTHGPAATSALVAVAAGTKRTPLGSLGELRLDPVSMVVPFAGTIGSSRRLRFTVPVPQNPWLRGRRLWFQGLQFGAQGRPKLTNSTWTQFQ